MTETIIRIHLLSVGGLGENRPFQKHRHRWENNIKMDLTEIECEGVNCIRLSQDSVQAGSCQHGHEPAGPRGVTEFLN
jgi:hypothetical protein